MAGFSLFAAGASYSDIEYGHPGGFSLRLDAEVPEGAGPFPAVILVHGGAWVAGDRKRSVEPLFAPLADAGFAWFSISYRLANPTDKRSVPNVAAAVAILGGSIDDVRTAVAFVREHAAEYHVDPEKIVLIGESAGAQLAAMAALKPGDDPPVRAVVAFYCPSDLVALVQKMPLIPESVRQAVRGTAFEDLLMNYLRELSPMSAIHTGAPPFLLIHGTADPIVPFQQSVDLCAKMTKIGSKCELYPVQGGVHGMRIWETAKDQTAYKGDMILWIKKQF